MTSYELYKKNKNTERASFTPNLDDYVFDEDMHMGDTTPFTNNRAIKFSLGHGGISHFRYSFLQCKNRYKACLREAVVLPILQNNKQYTCISKLYKTSGGRHIALKPLYI